MYYISNMGNKFKNIRDWILYLQAMHKICFSTKDIEQYFERKSSAAIKSSMDRLVKKGYISCIIKGFYVIMPRNGRMVEPKNYIDSMMKYLGRKYYVGTLSAAAYQGATHQAVMQYFVITSMPHLRISFKKGMKVNYICTKDFPAEESILKLQGEYSFLNVSQPFLTALDLVKFIKYSGSFIRVLEVLEELQESIQLSHITKDLITNYSISSIQRLGYLLDILLNNKKLANKIFKLCVKNKLRFVQIQLRPDSKLSNNFNDKWNVANNINLILEEWY